MPGIIPACAGSTLTLAVSRSRARDHPRMCGEHLHAFEHILRDEGSSPHVRGALNSGVENKPPLGIIPACAGSTYGLASICSKTRDHPRMCGEHNSILIVGGTYPGSSPHVRGARHELCHGSFWSGIIPACAGSTCLVPSLSLLPRDHPRMCGEHPCCNTTNNRVPGSSPHVRGAR